MIAFDSYNQTFQTDLKMRVSQSVKVTVMERSRKVYLSLFFIASLTFF